MNKKIYLLLIIPVLFIAFMSSCKDQGDSYLSWRNTTGRTMINIHNAYLHLSAYEDSVMYTGVRSAEIKANIFGIDRDSISEIISYGHCWAFENSQPYLTNLNKDNKDGYVKYSQEFQDTVTDFSYTSSIYDLGVDSSYFVRSFVIIQYRSGLTDTAYNQNVTEFRTLLPEDVWFHNNDFSVLAKDQRSEATSFVLNNKAYVTCGYNGSQLLSDLWSYDPEKDSWTQMSDFRGDPRMSGAAFVVGDTAYFGTGVTDAINHIKTDDMWKWTEEGGMYNIWIRIDSLGPGQERDNAIAFSLVVDNSMFGEEERGYIGLGSTNFPRNDLLYYDFREDFKGNKSGQAWVSGDPFLGGNRTEACVSVVNNLAIVGTGVDGSGNYKNDFFVFDPTIGSFGGWYGLNGCPAPVRANAVSFSLSFTRPNTGTGYTYFYFGTGRGEGDSLYNDWWSYDFQGVWKQCSDIREDNDIADGREGAVAFAIVRDHVAFGTLERGFVAMGKAKTSYKKDVWEYLP
ncbi:MAG: hypothetical protein JXL97_00225 [Bacteroidales bacterium]|nr:hypothetical protein [Bacteroidales bacterium]